MFNVNQRIDLLTSPVVQTWEPSLSNKRGSLQNHQIEMINQNQMTSCKCYIIPPHLQQHVKDLREQDDNEHIRILANVHKDKDEAFRAVRQATYHTSSVISWHWPHLFEEDSDEEKEEEKSVIAKFDPNPFIQKIVRSVYDCRHTERLPGRFVISAQGVPQLSGYRQKGSTRDETANKAMENAVNVFLFLLKQYQYNSIDGHGMPITSSIHYGVNYENAFWDGSQMVYGDGSDLFKAFVYFLDVVGHELAHGVTGNRLEYEDQAGALNEHFSDVIGYLVYMYVNKLDVNHADWVLADGILTYGKKTYPLRSFKAPGTAYNIPELGKDPQPAKYSDLYKGKDDNGGVHINSGIPNHAFYLFAIELGGFAWEKAGLIWFTTMMTPGAFKPNASMKDFAKATIKVADQLFPNDTKVYNAIRKAWTTVEVPWQSK